MDGSLIVRKPEVRRDHAHLNPTQVGRRQPLAIERAKGRQLHSQKKNGAIRRSSSKKLKMKTTLS